MLVLPVHHTRKNDHGDIDPFDNIAGYPNLQRAIEAGVMLSRVEEEDMDDVVKATFLVRSDPPIGEVLFEVRDGEIHVIVQEEEAMPQHRSEEERLMDFIRDNLPETQEGAIPTKQLLDMMEASDDIELTPRSIERRKLSEWVEEGLLSVIKGNAYRYYQGPRINQK